MRIGIEAQRIFRSNKHGMDIVALNMIKALQELDTINEYFIFTNSQDDISCLTETSNFKIIRKPGYIYPVWEQFVLPSLVAKYKIDVLHCTSNTAPIFLNVPLILTLHDIIYLENSPLSQKVGLYQKWGNFYRSIIVPLVVKKAFIITTVSNYEQKRIKEFFNLEDDKVQTLYNGVSNHFYAKALESEVTNVRLKYKLPEKYIFLLGNTDPKKNIQRTLNAYELYRNQNASPLPLVIADYAIEILMKEVESGNINFDTLSSIHLLGYVNNNDLAVIYQLSTLFLYPSVRESFGIPILESMASGVPVITSNTSAMPEVAGESALLIDPFNVLDISNKISQILNNKDLYNEYLNSGLSRVKDFKWMNTGKKLLSIFQSI